MVANNVTQPVLHDEAMVNVAGLFPERLPPPTQVPSHHTPTPTSTPHHHPSSPHPHPPTTQPSIPPHSLNHPTTSNHPALPSSQPGTGFLTEASDFKGAQGVMVRSGRFRASRAGSKDLQATGKWGPRYVTWVKLTEPRWSGTWGGGDGGGDGSTACSMVKPGGFEDGIHVNYHDFSTDFGWFG